MILNMFHLSAVVILQSVNIYRTAHDFYHHVNPPPPPPRNHKEHIAKQINDKK